MTDKELVRKRLGCGKLAKIMFYTGCLKYKIEEDTGGKYVLFKANKYNPLTYIFIVSTAIGLIIKLIKERVYPNVLHFFKYN